MKNLKKFEEHNNPYLHQPNVDNTEFPPPGVDDDLVTHKRDIDAENKLIAAAKEYVELYGREKLEELLDKLMPYGQYKAVIDGSQVRQK